MRLPRESFEARLGAYSALGAAAILALPREANAQVRNLSAADFSPGVPLETIGGPGLTHVKFSVGPIHNAYLQGDRSEFGADFEVEVVGAWVARPLSHSALLAPVTGALAGAGRLFEAGDAIAFDYRGYGGHPTETGHFGPGAVGIIGFEVPHGAPLYANVFGTNPYYGWLRVKVGNSGLSITLVDGNGDGIYGAYGLASDNVIAGVSAIPEPANLAGGLSLLALGAAGVREMRRRRQAATSA